ncbi:pentapeptide repeat-containing protein [Microbacterium sp. ARD32]|uniref:helix-turn-helix transcriptional regulator n=1 Tax=Microbacterium sp. ARD32 TaxID=2962577 RepID=UPI002881D082|nr:helix-turn-helix domain-containing protein [Microbacterium sp. ARD32]MDT0158313.1 pentapeptide repeat-containing protein [Microbacterium sp. ARD32]
MDITARASSIGALADDTRRALYEHVASQPEPVSRDAAAEAVGVPAHMARFHLDRLVAAGLLQTEFRRLSGRSGPGAGRPSKLYRRADGTVAVSLPQRRYGLVGHLLAGAIERAAQGADLQGAERQGADLHRSDLQRSDLYRADLYRAVAEVARDEGRRIAASAPPDVATGELGRLSAVLDAQGFEPRESDGALTLANCPFDSLAREHTQLVCSANLALIGGILEGMDCPHLRAHGEPHEGRCCVAIRPTA